MLRSLTIRNFRGIHDLTLNDLGRVNVFVGKNGSGKTTVLEAASIIANPASPGWLGRLGTCRELPPPSLEAVDALSTAFPDMNLRKKISFEFVTEHRAGPSSLVVTALTGETGLSEEQAKLLTEEAISTPVVSDVVSASDRLLGVEYSYQPSEGETVNTRMELISAGFAQKSEPQVEKLGAFYIHTRRSTSAKETATALTSLFERKLQGPFMEAIRKVDPRVETMQAGLRGNNPIVLVDIGLPSLIPMNALGDGFCRICLMLTGMVFGTSSLVLVDEVDSGLHRSVMRGFWESTLRMAESYDFQLFCSTHDEEMLYSTLPAFVDRPDDLRVFRLDRLENDSVTVRNYDYSLFQDAAKAGLDVR